MTNIYLYKALNLDICWAFNSLNVFVEYFTSSPALFLICSILTKQSSLTLNCKLIYAFSSYIPYIVVRWKIIYNIKRKSINSIRYFIGKNNCSKVIHLYFIFFFNIIINIIHSFGYFKPKIGGFPSYYKAGVTSYHS